MEHLRRQLKQLEGRGYKAYKSLQGSYDFGSFQLTVDHVQGDPFALPSRISVQVLASKHGIPTEFQHNRIRRTALEDFLGRALHAAISRHVKGRRGTGRSGEISIAVNGQQVLRRNAVLTEAEQIEARLLFALPGSGRSILASEAAEMFFHELPRVIEDGLLWGQRSLQAMQQHIESIEDQQALRAQLDGAGLVAFVADDAMLARSSGIDDSPLSDSVPFQSPPSLLRSFNLPNRGQVTGMGVPEGISLIVGGGFHGKSTLLQALERGVYDHIPGDGRELVVTRSNAVKIRAEDHRAVNGVDISPFIGTLPGNRPTDCFSTDNASGSTSQAANIVEALECGCDCLLIDEDSSATNFMIRDQRMQQLVPDDREPITPLLHRVRELHQQHGVSTVLVSGGSGDYLAVADTVLMFDNYRLFDVSEKARQLAGSAPAAAPSASLCAPRIRRVDLRTAPFPGQREAKILVRERRLLEYGHRRIDLSMVEQLLDSGQTEAIGRLLFYCHNVAPEQPHGLLDSLQQALREIELHGLDRLLPWKAGHLAMPRLYELLAAANRLRPEV